MDNRINKYAVMMAITESISTVFIEAIVAIDIEYEKKTTFIIVSSLEHGKSEVFDY